MVVGRGAQVAGGSVMSAELIKRLEAATGPDLELDAEIAMSAGLAERRNDFVYVMHPVEGSTHDLWLNVPYTASIDAALTLVPEGWRIWQMVRPASGEPWTVQAVPAVGGWAKEGDHRELPIALCIAALRARATP